MAAGETPFAAILRQAIEQLPGAIGGTLAAGDGETVDSHVRGGWRRAEWELLTAHHGVLFGHVRSWLHTRHYGDPELLVVSHRELHVLLRDVADGYFALIAIDDAAEIVSATRLLEEAAVQLKQEMA
jgi:predicted regulator of Ras-like GTPase activity (Roadblock/LC7/MglB family)